MTRVSIFDGLLEVTHDSVKFLWRFSLEQPQTVCHIKEHDNIINDLTISTMRSDEKGVIILMRSNLVLWWEGWVRYVNLFVDEILWGTTFLIELIEFDDEENEVIRYSLTTLVALKWDKLLGIVSEVALETISEVWALFEYSVSTFILNLPLLHQILHL
jgi:hypothetical protein